MKVLLIDVDSKIPNLALLKLSAFHKARGDEVGFSVRDPDLIYASVIFSKNRHLVDGLRWYYPKAKIQIGGTGYSLSRRLFDQVEFLKPDYDLYPSQYSQGFTSRGCIRTCHFCVVPKKEGLLLRWQHPKKFHDDRFVTIMLMDNNWLAIPDWFMETSGWIKDLGLRVLEHGLDVRLLDETNLKRLRELTFGKPLHFAFDYSSLETLIQAKIRLLTDFGFDLKHEVMFYVYCGSNRDFSDALHRCNVLRELGTQAFVMFNIKHRPSHQINALRRWSNRPALFWKTEFKDYTRCNTKVRQTGISPKNVLQKDVKKHV